jgi:sulfur carrier protein ThiS adenylyltransferase
MITPTTSTPIDRFSRQAELVPQDKLADLTATVIGVGAVGRQVALQLAAIGVHRLHIYDFDDVEATNITTQGYGHAELGLPKVPATAQAITRIDPGILVTPIPDRFRPRHEIGEAVFCAVDKIAAREAIWRTVGGICRFWADGRMLGENLRVLAASTNSERHYYKTTLFAAAEAEQGRCTARSTIYVANLCAALMVHQFTRWLRGLPLDRDVALNLLASEMVVADEGRV